MSIEAPYIVQPTYQFDGDDGGWSTFALEIGTPPQSFRVLPATIGEAIWVPSYLGCEGVLTPLSNCGQLRGANDYSNVRSRGFSSGNSTSWRGIGGSIYALGTEQNLFGQSNTGLYGQDNISLGEQPANGYGPSITNQVVAGISTLDFWLGLVGLGTSVNNFGTQASNLTTLLQSMKTQNLTTSLSYGYTAGQAYASPQIPGSLILGGYDQARLSSNAISFSINGSAQPQMLEVGVSSILATNVLSGGTIQLLSTPVVANIDSSVSQLWLPDAVCQAVSNAFGLALDINTGYFLVANDSVHSQLQKSSASITFTIGSSDNTGPTTTIKLPYNAVDLSVGIPFYNSSRPYFPIKRAANTSQITLGRAFLQESYIIVDWERNNITIGQAIAQNSTTSVQPILPPSSQYHSPAGVPNSPASSTTATSAPTLASGAIAGIAVAIIVTIAVFAGLVCLLLRRRRRNAQRVQQQGFTNGDGGAQGIGLGVTEHYADEKKDRGKSPGMNVTEMTPMGEMTANPHDWPRKEELPNSEIHELPAGNGANAQDRELMSTPIMELEGERIGSELEVNRTGFSEASRPPVSHHDSEGSLSVMSSGRPPLSNRQSDGSVSAMSPTRPPLSHRESEGTVSLMSGMESRPQSPGVRSSILSGHTIVEGISTPPPGRASAFWEAMETPSDE